MNTLLIFWVLVYFQLPTSYWPFFWIVLTLDITILVKRKYGKKIAKFFGIR